MMSSPSSFPTQVAAVMEVLAKAAVAEITRLVQDETVVLRLEMSRRDAEIQELKGSLNLMEVELCKAREAATRRETEEKKEQATPAVEEAARQPCAVYIQKQTNDSPREPQGETEGNHDLRPVVKHEPKEELAVQEMTDNRPPAAAASDELIWSLSAYTVFEKSSKVDIPAFLSEEISDHTNTDRSYKLLTTTQEGTGPSLSVSIKEEAEVRPSAYLQPVHSEHFKHVSGPSASQDQCLEPTPAKRRSTANTEDKVSSRNQLRRKKQMNVWRTTQQLLVCPERNKRFARQPQLQDHKLTHQTAQRFMCLQCGKSFAQKYRLQRHQLVHTGEKPFNCEICGKTFARPDHCLRHKRFHSGLKPYSCSRCSKSFTTGWKLKHHQEVHL